MFDIYPENRDSTIATLRRATIEKTDDSGTQQILKKMRGLASEQPEDVYRPQQHGLSSHAPAGSEGLFLSLGGRSDRILGLGFEHRQHRPKNLPEGAVALYDADGKVLKLFKDKAEWKAGNKPIEIIEVTTFKVVAAERIELSVGDTKVVITANRVDLGGEGGSKVVTVSGPSRNVYAVT